MITHLQAKVQAARLAAKAAHYAWASAECARSIHGTADLNAACLALAKESEAKGDDLEKWVGLLRAYEALTCVCGHLWHLHDGHTYSPPSLPPSFCSQGDGCQIFTPLADILREIEEAV